MTRFIITTHRKLDGVALSKPGHWGGMRFDDEDAAEGWIKGERNGRPYTIERERA